MTVLYNPDRSITIFGWSTARFHYAEYKPIVDSYYFNDLFKLIVLNRTDAGSSLRSTDAFSIKKFAQSVILIGYVDQRPIIGNIIVGVECRELSV